MKTHIFDSTKEAYDATQCSEDIESGDILLIPSENVVGVAATWPFAVTPITGALHGLVDDYIFEGKEEHLNAAAVAAKKHIYPVAAEDSYILVTEKPISGETYYLYCYVGTECVTIGTLELEHDLWVVDPHMANFGDEIEFYSYELAMESMVDYFKTIKDGVVWMLARRA